MRDRHILTPADVERLRARSVRVQPGPARMRWEADEVDDVSGSAFVTLVAVGCILGTVALVGFAWIVGTVWG